MTTRRIPLTALMAALVFVLTVVIRLPTAAGGYLHLGDSAIAFSALAFGPWIGGLAGGLGTGLADLYGGYPQFALISFVVHGLQGWVMGLLVQRRLRPGIVILAVLSGSAIVVAGYFLAEIFMVGTAAALSEVPGNTVQSLVGGALGVSLYLAVKRAYPPLTRYHEQSGH